MSKCFDLYGYHVDDLEWARDDAEKVLGRAFSRRHSYHHGGFYYFSGVLGQDTDQYLLKWNRNAVESEHEGKDVWDESGFKTYPVILYANNPQRSGPDEIKNRLVESGLFVHLRREELP